MPHQNRAAADREADLDDWSRLCKMPDAQVQAIAAHDARQLSSKLASPDAKMMSGISSVLQICALFVIVMPLSYARADSSAPSRPPIDHCAWEQLMDRGIGLFAWVQRCDFGFRQIHFELSRNALAIRYSDGGPADPLVEVLDVLPGEPPAVALKRIFAERTEKMISEKCKLAPYVEKPAAAGVERFIFIPDATYQETLDAQADPNEVGEPPCGAWGETPDGIQYFEVQSHDARKLLFVRIGQEEPLFDEQTLQVLPPE